MASSTSSAAAAVPSGGASASASTSRRKELTRALRSAFSFSNLDGSNSHSNSSAATATATVHIFEGYAPPESLLDLIDDYAGSSDVVQRAQHPSTAAAAVTVAVDGTAGGTSSSASTSTGAHGGAAGVPPGSGSGSGPGSGSASAATVTTAAQAGTSSSGGTGGGAGTTASSGGLGSGLTGREKDIRRIQDTLLEDCFNEGILALGARASSNPDIAALQARARSALVLVLDKFASMDSDVVSPLELRYIWWERLLQPALLHSPMPPAGPGPRPAASSGSGTAGHAHDKGKRASIDDEKARLAAPATTEFITLGRAASRAARELVLKALCHDPEERDNTKWRSELFSVCFGSEPDSLAHRNLQEVLTGFCKAHPKVTVSLCMHTRTQSARTEASWHHGLRRYSSPAYTRSSSTVQPRLWPCSTPQSARTHSPPSRHSTPLSSPGSSRS